jgi:hypothetical protein
MGQPIDYPLLADYAFNTELARKNPYPKVCFVV